MMKFYSFALRRLWLAFALSLIASGGIGQHFASASPRMSRVTMPDGSFEKANQMISLKDALSNLKKRYGFTFAYQPGLLNDKYVPAVLLNNPQLPPETIVARMLEACHLEYKQINSKQFSIFTSQPKPDGTKTPNKSSAISPPLNSADIQAIEQAANVVPDIIITGQVTGEEDGQPLPGVNILLKGTSRGTNTDANGNFSLSIPDAGGTLVFSFIGFVSQEIDVTSATALTVALKSDAATLGEVVVTALGIEKSKKSVAYSVTEVKGDEFTQARETNVANALTGKIAGVNASGMATGPGGSSRVIIRGNGSLSGNNQPLYVINGMPMDNSVPGGQNNSDGMGNNVDRGDGIGGINPDDIESISVLKGGPAAALYGARASNGVILITTKKGKAQKGVGVEINSNFTGETICRYSRMAISIRSGCRRQEAHYTS